MIDYNFTLEDDESDVYDNLLYRELKEKVERLIGAEVAIRFNLGDVDETTLMQLRAEVAFLKRLKKKVMSSRESVK